MWSVLRLIDSLPVRSLHNFICFIFSAKRMLQLQNHVMQNAMIQHISDICVPHVIAGKKENPHPEHLLCSLNCNFSQFENFLSQCHKKLVGFFSNYLSQFIKVFWCFHIWNNGAIISRSASSEAPTSDTRNSRSWNFLHISWNLRGWQTWTGYFPPSCSLSLLWHPTSKIRHFASRLHVFLLLYCTHLHKPYSQLSFKSYFYLNT